MPIYTYRCRKCGDEEDVILPVAHRDFARTHSCGGEMAREVALPLPAIVKLTGKGMALDTLNSDKALPNRWYKNKYEQMAKVGFEKPPKRVW